MAVKKLADEAENTGAEVVEQEPQVNPDELVQLKVPYDKHKDDLYVSVNGRRFLIQRGKTVVVPLYVAEIVRLSLEQDERAAMLVEKYVAEYEKQNR